MTTQSDIGPNWSKYTLNSSSVVSLEIPPTNSLLALLSFWNEKSYKLVWIKRILTQLIYTFKVVSIQLLSIQPTHWAHDWTINMLFAALRKIAFRWEVIIDYKTQQIITCYNNLIRNTPRFCTCITMVAWQRELAHWHVDAPNYNILYSYDPSIAA